MTPLQIRSRDLHLVNLIQVRSDDTTGGMLLIFRIARSDDYSDNVTKSNLKAILLNKVVVGKGCKMTHDNTTLTAPPAGYDSVGCVLLRWPDSYSCLTYVLP